MSRRGFAFGGLAAASAAGVAGTGEADAAPGVRSANPGVYRFAVGNVGVSVVSDGQIAFPAWPAYAPDEPEETVFAAMRDRYLTPPDYRLDANVLLLDASDRRVLIDTGWGATFAPSVGRLTARLDAIGVDPETIDVVVLSHLHPDHVGGLVAPDGRATFARADVVVLAAERAQWFNGPDFGAMEVDERLRTIFVDAVGRLRAIEPRVRSLRPGEEVARGVTLLALPGHTAGHCGVAVASGDQRMVYVGDCFHDQAFDLDHPGWRTAFDYDPDQAERTRRALLDQAAAEGTLLAAYHMPFPGLGRVRRAKDAYCWEAERWRVVP